MTLPRSCMLTGLISMPVVLAQHLSVSDMAALRDIVAEIQQRLARFQHGFGESV